MCDQLVDLAHSGQQCNFDGQIMLTLAHLINLEISIGDIGYPGRIGFPGDPGRPPVG